MKPVLNVILQIKSQYNTFNETEKKVADYVINNTRELIYSTISQVAERLQVSDATIFRFCKKINLNGFQELKITLATEFTEGLDNNYANEQINENDTEQTIVNKVFNANITALNDTLMSINSKHIEEASDAILAADQIVFYGNGGSGIVAMDAHHKFLRTGLKVSVYTDNHLQLMSLAQLSEKDLIVIISHSGSNLNMINLLDIAKDNGTKSIAITSFSKSPVSEKADIALNAISQETGYQFEAFASRIAHLTIIDALYMSVVLKRKDLTHAATQKMRNAISYTRM
ncbi:MurR/RpiR family transcriptional regulator [Candidatus Clostridium radicumherbarum]|uniref:MurR/RpiR family transcriptional regulator n=1 Tax=Candidatus Clostridium radicumherbarum TaxID=3381662 RepID=A0ABW8TU42_9CLOT